MAEKYYVAPGKSISISRGIAGPGEPISAKDLRDPVTKKDAEKLGDAEVKKLKERQFQLLVDSKKCLLTKTKPDAPSKAIEVDVRPDEIQEVDLATEPKKKKYGSGAQRK